MNSDRRSTEEIFPVVIDPEQILREGRKAAFVANSAPNTDLLLSTPSNIEAALHQL